MTEGRDRSVMPPLVPFSHVPVFLLRAVASAEDGSGVGHVMGTWRCVLLVRSRTGELLALLLQLQALAIFHTYLATLHLIAPEEVGTVQVQ